MAILEIKEQPLNKLYFTLILVLTLATKIDVLLTNLNPIQCNQKQTQVAIM